MSRQYLASCPCGSGKQASAHFDARGIFLTYVCSKCKRSKLASFRLDVLTDPNYWHDEPLDSD